MSFQRAEQPLTLKGMEAARAFLEPCVTGDRAGDWWVAHVDEEVRCIHLASYVAGGPAPSLSLPVMAVLGDAVRLGSAGLFLARRPAQVGADELGVENQTGKRLAEAAGAIDVTLVDHLVFGEGKCLSMRRAGLL